MYTCKAENILGMMTLSATLTVQGEEYIYSEALGNCFWGTRHSQSAKILTTIVNRKD